MFSGADLGVVKVVISQGYFSPKSFFFPPVFITLNDYVHDGTLKIGHNGEFKAKRNFPHGLYSVHPKFTDFYGRQAGLLKTASLVSPRVSSAFFIHITLGFQCFGNFHTLILDSLFQILASLYFG
jgi:hypothetical protein